MLVALSILSDPGAPQARSEVFGPAPQVSARGVLGLTPNGFAELLVYLTNETDKDLLTAGLYVVPRDAQGRELADWTSRNRFATYVSLQAGQTAEYAFQTIQEGVASMDVWICSCTFADGSRWGDPDCTPTEAMSRGIPVEVTADMTPVDTLDYLEERS